MSLEKLDNDSILMSLLEEQELDEYYKRAIMYELKQIGFDGENQEGIDVISIFLFF